jgi:hypothetical protein
MRRSRTNYGSLFLVIDKRIFNGEPDGSTERLSRRAWIDDTRNTGWDADHNGFAHEREPMASL